MYKEILKLLKCPKCSGELNLAALKEENGEIVEGKLSCEGGHDWAIRDGVINFGSVEQELANNWTEAYEQDDEEELDRKILEGNPQNLLILNDKAKKFIIDKLNSKENEFILDIATGRGALFKEVVKSIKTDAQIICTDLSFVVLKYDRLKARKINPAIKVNYIACDATNLPLKDNSVDAAESFFGIANMLNVAADGLKEAQRVLKAGHSLHDSYVIIKEDSEGYKKLKEFCEENNIIGAEEFTLESGVEKAYIKVGFDMVNLVTIGESIGEKSELDLLPFEGEWFAIVIAEGIK